MVFLFALFHNVRSQIHLSQTRDAPRVEYYDCFYLGPLYYCHRPYFTTDLIREKDDERCFEENGGLRHRFSNA